MSTCLLFRQQFLIFCHILPQDLEVVIYNELCNIHTHECTRLHSADEALDPARVIEPSCQLWVIESYPWIEVGIRFPYVGIIPAYRIFAVKVDGTEISRNYDILVHRLRSEYRKRNTYLEFQGYQTRTRSQELEARISCIDALLPEFSDW